MLVPSPSLERHVIDRLDRLLSGGDDTEVLVECRNCGRTLDEDAAVCPACEATEFARYEV